MRVPAGTGGVGLRVGTFGRPGPALDADDPRAPAPRRCAAGSPPGWRQGDVVVPVPELGAERRDAEVCVRHDGAGELALAGGPGTGEEARRGGRRGARDGAARVRRAARRDRGGR